MGLSTWLFNAISHRLPKLPPNLPPNLPTYLPPPHLAGVGVAMGPSRRQASGRSILASPPSTRPSRPSVRPSPSSARPPAAAAAAATSPKARITHPFTLPAEEDAPYWGYMKELLLQAAELTKRARFRAEREGIGKGSSVPLRSGYSCTPVPYSS